ncbi:MAG: Jag N-terminal domain-containing protein [Actinomycetota bacterium]|nr:Jag N-terminal domain-containing protein [Actinomycetota bacterium]
MEWIEVTGKTIEEAKDAALDQLGVDEVDAEFEVVDAPKPGLFGRLRSEARVRARVSPSTPPPKLDRRDRRRGGGGREGGGRSAKPRAPKPAKEPTGATPEEGGAMTDEAVVVGGEDEIARTFLSGLLDAFGLQGTIENRRLEEDTTEVAVHGEGLGLLIGPRGQTLMAVQELARTVVQRHLPPGHGRIVVDVGGYRQARRAALERFTRSAAEEVLANGVPKVLEAMPPADRKVVHDTVNTIPGVITLSEGEEPRRRVVIAREGAS